MGKLTNQVKIKRLRSQGYSRKDIARVTGSSVSAVGRLERGETKGDSFSAPLGEFFSLRKGAKQKALSGEFSLPSAKPAREKKARKVKAARVPPLVRAEGQLSRYRADEKVVVQMTNKQTGKSRTLFARGGIDAGSLSEGAGYGGGLGGAIGGQSDSQYGEDDDPADYYDYDMWEIDIDEY